MTWNPSLLSVVVPITPPLIQFATADQAFLFRLRPLKNLGVIKEILSDPDIIKAGVAIRDDIKKLKEIEDFTPGGFEELADLAGELKHHSGEMSGEEFSQATSSLMNFQQDIVGRLDQVLNHIHRLDGNDSSQRDAA